MVELTMLGNLKHSSTAEICVKSKEFNKFHPEAVWQNKDTSTSPEVSGLASTTEELTRECVTIELL
jgi:hypothetical protein